MRPSGTSPAIWHVVGDGEEPLLAAPGGATGPPGHSSVPPQRRRGSASRRALSTRSGRTSRRRFAVVPEVVAHVRGAGAHRAAPKTVRRFSDLEDGPGRTSPAFRSSLPRPPRTTRPWCATRSRSRCSRAAPRTNVISATAGLGPPRRTTASGRELRRPREARSEDRRRGSTGARVETTALSFPLADLADRHTRSTGRSNAVADASDPSAVVVPRVSRRLHRRPLLPRTQGMVVVRIRAPLARRIGDLLRRSTGPTSASRPRTSRGGSTTYDRDPRGARPRQEGVAGR